MINIIDNDYYKEGVVQLMLPICSNCTYIGPEGIKFHSNYDEILMNDYILHPKRNLFPFHETPLHSEDIGAFANQLLKLDQQYLAIYSNGKNHQFRTVSVFQVDKTIYVNNNLNLKMNPQKKQKMSLQALKEKLQNVLISNDFFYTIDDNGELYEYRKNDIDIPLSGVGIFSDGTKLKAYVYKIKVDKEQVSIKTQELNLKQSQQLDLENCSLNPEPVIRKK